MDPRDHADEQRLNPQEIERFVRIIGHLLNVHQRDQFVQLMRNEVRQLLPFEHAICGVGYINPHSISGCELISVDFPEAYFTDIRQSDGGIHSPLMQRWIDSQAPIVFDPEQHAHEVPADWLSVFKKHGLRNSLAHGVRDLNSTITSYFNFCGLPAPISLHQAYLLRLLVPHLHIAITQLVAQALRQPSAALPQLTPREKEVVSWLYLGKTNWEIGQILGIAEKTVKNNLSAIFDKVGVNNRTQLLSRITEMKLLSF